MSEDGYKIRNKAEISLKFCQEHKGLLLHGWCIMSGHVHLLASSLIQDLSGNAGEANSRNTNYQCWRQDNQPKECGLLNIPCSSECSGKKQLE